MSTEWLSASEAADRLGVSLRTLGRYDALGLTQPVQIIPTSPRRYDPDAIERLRKPVASERLHPDVNGSWRNCQHRVYWMDCAAFDELLARAAGECERCHAQGVRLQIDHDHDTNQVRGLLCRSCNVLLGRVDTGKVPVDGSTEAYLRLPAIVYRPRSSRTGETELRDVVIGGSGDPIRSVRVPDDVWYDAQVVAARRGETVGNVVRTALARYVKRHSGGGRGNGATTTRESGNAKTPPPSL